MSQAIQKGLIALLASLLCAASVAVAAEPEFPAEQVASSGSARAGTGGEAIVLAASDAPPTSTPAQPPAPEPAPAAPSEDSAAQPSAEGAPAAEPQVPNENEKKLGLWLMVIVIVAAVIWLFSRNKPKSNLPK